MEKKKREKCKICGLEMSMYHSKEFGNCIPTKGGFSEAKESWKEQLYDLYSEILR